MSHFVSIALDGDGDDDVIASDCVKLLTLCEFDFAAGKSIFEFRCDKIIESIYSVDDANIGVIAHEPMLFTVSCDKMIFGS